jgi:enterochelin esterase family protein
MKNFLFLTVVALLLCLPGNAQQALWGGQEVVSPEIHADRTVTFRFLAPKAVRVEVTGDFLPTQTPAELTEGKDGVWEYTTPTPLEPELYSYAFLVDGLKCIDPNNVFLNRDVASLTNIFLIEGGRDSLYGVNRVPHGSLTRCWYESPASGFARRLTVYTPPGYGKGKQRYPVFYLLHGMGGDEEAWVTLGRAVQILDNLIARGLAKPMIVVMPNGNAAQEAAPGESPEGMHKPVMRLPHTMDGVMEERFPEVTDFVDANWRTLPGRTNRAIAGLSMGGFHSMTISRQYPGRFGYVGLFSAAILPGEGADSEVYRDADAKLRAQFAAGLSLYWIGIGKTDFLYKGNEDFRRKLDDLGLSYTYYESEEGHIWKNWRIYLTEFVPLLFK